MCLSLCSVFVCLPLRCHPVFPTHVFSSVSSCLVCFWSFVPCWFHWLVLCYCFHFVSALFVATLSSFVLVYLVSSGLVPFSLVLLKLAFCSPYPASCVLSAFGSSPCFSNRNCKNNQKVMILLFPIPLVPLVWSAPKVYGVYSGPTSFPIQVLLKSVHLFLCNPPTTNGCRWKQNLLTTLLLHMWKNSVKPFYGSRGSCM